jgi:hypothetical protein
MPASFVEESVKVFLDTLTFAATADAADKEAK